MKGAVAGLWRGCSGRALAGGILPVARAVIQSPHVIDALRTSCAPRPPVPNRGGAVMATQMAEIVMALALVAIGGFLGSMARFWVSGVVARRYGEIFPWGTLAVNVTGAAVIGVLAALVLAHDTHAIEYRAAWSALVIGFLGSYTTVSSFSLQTLALVRNGEPGRALANIALSLALCLAVTALGWLATAQALALWGAP